MPVTASPNRLGVLAGDLQGFPNGRRLTDDVVDIGLQALEGAAQTGKLVDALAAGDKVDANDNAFGDTFPYVALPNGVGVNTVGGGTGAAGARAGAVRCRPGRSDDAGGATPVSSGDCRHGHDVGRRQPRRWSAWARCSSSSGGGGATACRPPAATDTTELRPEPPIPRRTGCRSRVDRACRRPGRARHTLDTRRAGGRSRRTLMRKLVARLRCAV